VKYSVIQYNETKKTHAKAVASMLRFRILRRSATLLFEDIPMLKRFRRYLDRGVENWRMAEKDNESVGRNAFFHERRVLLVLELIIIFNE